MTLSAGTRLGPYEILSPLGAGGMGEVYRARDTRLERTVAVKVIPQQLSASPEVRQRFEREAKTISQLSHPHICALYDVGREGETEYLVMELLEGETLSERLARGPLPLEQTLKYGVEIADALDKAHRQGIVHRDLKPGNVMLTKSGVKLLDFGLAKALPPPRGKGVGGEGLTSLPTAMPNLTQEGTILGTFQYMAPEQLEGKEADARTDIFAFGCVVYEMATGKKAFSASSQASLIGAILHTDPAPMSSIQPMTPAGLDRVVKTCLAKDPDERWQSAADIKRELGWIAEGSQAGMPAPVVARRKRAAILPWAIAGVAALVAVGSLLLHFRPAAAPPERILLSIVPPERTVLTDYFAISPDGRRLAFVAIAGGKSLLRVRELGSEAVRTLLGTEGCESPFWSWDGRSVGFFAQGKLRKIELSTGSVETLCDAELGRGGSWSSKGEILFTGKSVGGISRVAASGGSPAPATSLEPGDVMHRWCQFLPDGRRFLYFVKAQKPEGTGTYLGSLDSRSRKLILRNGATGVFVPPGSLLYVRGETLLAQRFDVDRGELEGEPESVTRSVMRADISAYLDMFTVSSTGIIVYRSGSGERRLTWVDRHGTALQTVGPPGVIMNVSLAPDDRTAAFTLRQVETGTQSAWTLDLERGVATPFADGAWQPIWAPDGRTIFYRYEGKGYEIRKKPFRGPGVEESVLSGNFTTPHDVSADGRFLLFTRTARGGQDIGVLDLRSAPKPKAQMLLETEFQELRPGFSPDGRWFVHSSNEPGQSEIFVRRFPPTDERWQISTAGGQQPFWSPQGKEIFYVALDGKLMAVPISPGASFSFGAPQPLFQTPLRLSNLSAQYALSADGQRFLMVVPTQDLDSGAFQVLLNWRAGAASR